MKRHRLIKLLTLVLVFVMILSTGSAAANNQSGLTTRDKITPAERKAAAQVYAELVAAAEAAGTLALPTLVEDPANGYLVPDYFGVANWAYSPPLRKFVDALPGLGPDQANALGQYIPVAVPDKATYVGSDYYEIAVIEYKEQMHSDLPPTTNRGYVQISTAEVPGKQVPLFYPDGTPIYKGDGTRAYAVDDPHYLGPAIVSDDGFPVRIKFYNLLPVGSAGDLFIPVDTTVMGSGSGQIMGINYTQNRSNIHLHGNNTVWISDGTPHQWITPAGEDTPYPEGVSVVGVPDMEDVSAKDDGTTTLFYTNAQSARLMFYHDHSFGITRLNVYIGEAAPFLIQDDVEKDLINGTNNTGVNPLLKSYLPGVGIPLVIQDRTFVDAATVMETDPTWAWGTNDYTPGTPYIPTTGDLWYPHVYMPAQNPYAIDGVNPFGRWMYGPWFYPPTSEIKYGLVPNPYSTPDLDPNDPNYRPPVMPGTPNPSMPGESFMDTPMVNGTAYPYLEVEPKAYRFRILNAANDRFFNLMLYVADDSYAEGTPGYMSEVRMVPSTTALPTHLEQIMPDPTMAGPEWIQIGTEGGFLPAPVVVPNQPTTWNLVGTAFNFGVVDQHALLLGTAERADVIVDFSKYAGKTLILYNDAPAPYPANDTRYDYYTGNPDQTAMGGAPQTQPGYGPNTRTIMQIRVSGTVGEVLPEYDVAALEAVFAKGAIPATATTDANTGVFATDQEAIVIPQAAYNSAYGVTNLPADAPRAYVQLDENDKTFSPIDENGILQEGTVITLPLEPKAMHDEMSGVYDEYGRMSGMLGLTSPVANSINAPFIAYGYASPPVDLLKATDADLSTTQIGTLPDGTQIWQITHNGVDTHTIHTHLFNGQLINRVAWDGALMPPDDNELGWKETFRVNPLEQTVIALRPKVPTAAQIPFDVPNSIRLIDPTMPEGAVLAEPPPEGWFTPGGVKLAEIKNHFVNFGWEYVYHCHILSHEEMDMMHTMAAAVTPKTTADLAAVQSGTGNKKTNTLTWTDRAANETHYLVQRSATSSGPWSTIATLPANNTVTPVARTYADVIGNTNNAYYYQVIAINIVGDTQTTGFPTITQQSAPSNVVVVGTQAIVKPAAPTGLTATIQTGPQVSLAWKDNAVNETGYMIQRSTNAGAWATLMTIGAFNGTGNAGYTDTTVLAGFNYAYRVYAVNAAGLSASSNIATAILPSAPAAPSNVTVSAGANKKRNAVALVNWTDNATNETGYVVEYATNATFTANLTTVTVGANTTAYTTGNLNRYTPYYFRITAINAYGQSAPVNAMPFPIITP